MTLFRSRDYSYHATGDYSFSVADGGGQGDVSPRTTHLTSQKFDCCIYSDDFVLSRSRENVHESFILRHVLLFIIS